MLTKQNPLVSMAVIANTRPNYSKFDNFLVTLVIWRLLPFALADWIINHRRNRYD